MGVQYCTKTKQNKVNISTGLRGREEEGGGGDERGGADEGALGRAHDAHGVRGVARSSLARGQTRTRTPTFTQLIKPRGDGGGGGRRSAREKRSIWPGCEWEVRDGRGVLVAEEEEEEDVYRIEGNLQLDGVS